MNLIQLRQLLLYLVLVAKLTPFSLGCRCASVPIHEEIIVGREVTCGLSGRRWGLFLVNSVRSSSSFKWKSLERENLP